MIVTVSIALLLAAAVVSANVAVDIYGLFRDPTQRSLRPYGDERLAKYLLSLRYVPANFDGALIGTSVSANWPTGNMQSSRLYNESLEGGNIVEEKAILEQLLVCPRIRAAILIVHPWLTATHDMKTVELAPREVWGALGSKHLFDAYKNVVDIRLGREPQIFDGAGTETFGEGTKKLNEHLRAMMRPGAEFDIDPIALAAYRDVVAALHARQIPVAFVIPPTSAPILAAQRDAFARYAATLLAMRLPGDRVLDFNGDEFAAFRSDVGQFSDGVHLRDSAAAKLTAIIDERMREWIAAGWLERR